MTIQLATGYDVLLSGAFLPPDPSGHTLDAVLGYHAASGAIRIYATDGAGHLHARREDVLGPGWTHLLRGRFGGGGASDLLAYNASSGAAQLWTTSARGDLHPHSRLALGPGWTQIVRGRFGPASNLNTLLCYRASVGAVQWFELDAVGRAHASALRSDRLAAGFTQLFVASFDRDRAHSDLAIYRAGDGALSAWASTPEVEFRALGQGITTLQGSLLEASNFIGGLSTEVLIYDPGRGEALIHGFGSDRRWTTPVGPVALPTGFTHVRAGRFDRVDGRADLLFYDRVSGEAGIWAPARGNAFLDAL